MNFKYPRLPSGYSELAYIESTGTQYIDTGLKGNQNTSVKIEGQLTATPQTNYIGLFGSRTSASENNIGIAFSNTTPNVYIDFGNYLTNRLESSWNMNRFVAYNSVSERYFNNDKSTTTYSGTFETPTNMRLFSLDFNYSPTYNFVGKVFYCYIWSGTTLVFNGVPAIRNSDSEVGMYDLVSNTFLTNQGTGSFIAGEKLHYVKDIDIVQGINLWNEEWEVGDINTVSGQNTTSTNNIRSKDYISVIPNTIYYFKAPKNVYIFRYDSEKAFINYVDFAVNQTFTVPSNCAFIRFRVNPSYGTTYNHDICINLSNPDINGHYYPYAKGVKRIRAGKSYVQTNSFISQATPSDTFPPSKLLEKQGNTVVYNQLHKPTASTTDTVSFIPSENDVITFTSEIKPSYSVIDYISIPVVVGHMYYIGWDITIEQGSSSINLRGQLYNGTTAISTWWQTPNRIYTVGSGDNIKISLTNANIGTTAISGYFTLKLFDLTQWFNGNGNIPQDLLDTPANWSKYYSGDNHHSTGELLNANGRYLVCTNGDSEVVSTVDSGNEELLFLDKKDSDGTIHKNTGKITNMASLYWQTDWYTEAEGYRLYTQIPAKAKGISNIKCERYVIAGTGDSGMANKTITGNSSNNYIYIKDNGYANASELIASLQNVKLQYELATPTTSQGTPFTPDFKTDKNGSMTWKDTDNNLVAIPQSCQIDYSAKTVIYEKS